LIFLQLENDIRRLPVPVAQWPELQNEEQRRRQEAWHLASDPQKEMIRKMVGDHAAEPEFLASFDTNACLDAITAAGLWHSALTEKDDIVPNAAFLGGILTATYLAVFRRP